MSSEASPADAAPAPRRGRAWAMVVVAGALSTAIGVVAFAMVLQVALSGTGGPLLPALAVMVLGVVTGGILASLAFRGLGVRPGVRTASLGALVGVVGVLLPWVAVLLLRLV